MNRYLIIVPHEDQHIEADAKTVESVGIESLISIGCSISGYIDSCGTLNVIVNFPSIEAFIAFDMGILDDLVRCSICGRLIPREAANNAAPFDGVCCDDCNVKIVIPRRLAAAMAAKKVFYE